MRVRARERLVAEVRTYHAEAERDGASGASTSAKSAGSTQARNLREVEPMARDLIAIMDEIPEDSFELDVQIALPEEVRAALERSAELREQAARSQAEAARLARSAAGHLHDQGLPLRDIGKMLGVSYQRAHQLVDEAHPPAARRWPRSTRPGQGRATGSPSPRGDG